MTTDRQKNRPSVVRNATRAWTGLHTNIRQLVLRYTL